MPTETKKERADEIRVEGKALADKRRAYGVGKLKRCRDEIPKQKKIADAADKAAKEEQKKAGQTEVGDIRARARLERFEAIPALVEAQTEEHALEIEAEYEKLAKAAV
jgi:hypothetical protein